MLRVTESPFDAPRFNHRHAPPVLLPLPAEGLPAGTPEESPGAPALLPAPAHDAAALAEAAALVRARRLGGSSLLPDPGAGALGLPPGGAVIAFTAAAAAEALRENTRPVLLARDPWRGSHGDPAAPPPGARQLPGRLAPWTLLDAAVELRGASHPMAVLARLAGVPCPGAPPGTLAGAWAADPFRRQPCTLVEALELLDHWRDRARENRRVAVCLGIAFWKRDHIRALLARDVPEEAFMGAPGGAAGGAAGEAPRGAFRGTPRDMSGDVPEDVSGAMRQNMRENLSGNEPGHMPATAPGNAPATASRNAPGNAPATGPRNAAGTAPTDAPRNGPAPGNVASPAPLRFARDAAGALRLARQAIAAGQPGGIAAWASREPAGLRQPDNPPVFAIEDGFLRSRGLGARFLPGASYCLDEGGAYYDPERRTRLEAILRDGIRDPAVLDRARALRAKIVARGIGKYHLSGAAPVLQAPPGRRVILVPGQVEDDASVRHGGGAIQSNLALLRVVRARCPDDFLVYKPHPDLEAGFRRGRLASAELDAVADQVVTGTPLSALFPLVAEVHTLTSLSGFEALLREVPVATYGRPFYAGWGLTRDFAPEGFPHRGTPRTLDELVAAALLLYPRYLDPVTLLPCTAELILERLEDPTAWKLSPLTLHRGLEGHLKRWVARLRGRR
ncbi:capsular polysaccharide export protein, LipB/KpsS family [Roseomonas elaeocarpi]|uniref:Beta-3-deoxy-D-manno-oct-2-ulosonic acid transferase n=1 Tax=Roseomonas elaeocarpi TaxID=907779 RepID=A0ABV6JY37_9PROT